MRYIYRFIYVLLACLICSCADISSLESEVEDVREEISVLEKECESINSRIESLQELVAQIQARETITGVTELKDVYDEVIGYVITFKNAETVTLYLPVIVDYPAGNTPPVISVIEDEEGVWWTMNGEYIVDAQGNKVPVGASVISPQLKVEDEKWYVSLDGGKTWEKIETGSAEITSGIASVTVGEDDVTFVLTDGTSFVVPKSKSATLDISSDKKKVVAGSSVCVEYKFSSPTGIANVTAFGNDYVGNVSITHMPQSACGNIEVDLSKDYDVSLQKVYVYLDYGEGTIVRVLEFAEHGIFDIEPVAAIPAVGGEVSFNINNSGYPYVNIQIVQGESWFTGNGGTYTALANTDSRARVAAVEFKASTSALDQYGNFTKTVYVVQLGTGSFPCYEEYVGLWKMSTTGRSIEVCMDQTRTGYLIYGLSDSANGAPEKAVYNASTGSMQMSSYTFTLTADKNKMTSNYNYATFERQGLATYYNNGDVVMLNTASAGYTPLNLVILGDGYQEKDLRQGGKFEKRARSAMSSFFAAEPYKSFQNRFNVYMVTYASNDEGTDIKSSGITKDTYFDTYCQGGGNTLAECNYSKVQEVVRGLGLTESNYNMYRTAVIMLVNTSEQSGTCWYSKGGKIDSRYVGDGIKSFAIATLAAETMGASGLIRHEVGGHAFGRLADEYNWGAVADDAKKQSLRNEQNNNGFYWNVTADTGSGSPWKHFIGLAGYDDVGYYEGAWGCSAGIYRPTENSIMLNNQGNFNAPSREIIYKRIVLQSEGAGAYSFEKFLEYDKSNL